MTDDEAYTDFERGERQALLHVRTFLATHGAKEVDAYCAQRLHDIKMDARADLLESRKSELEKVGSRPDNHQR